MQAQKWAEPRKDRKHFVNSGRIYRCSPGTQSKASRTPVHCTVLAGPAQSRPSSQEGRLTALGSACALKSLSLCPGTSDIWRRLFSTMCFFVLREVAVQSLKRGETTAHFKLSSLCLTSCVFSL